MTRADLQRELAAQGFQLNVKTLYRLCDPSRPLERIELRSVGALCRVLGLSLNDLIVFSEQSTATLEQLPAAKQRRLDELMDRHNEGNLLPADLAELRALVDEAERIARGNARRLAEHRRRMRQAPPDHPATVAG